MQKRTAHFPKSANVLPHVSTAENTGQPLQLLPATRTEHAFSADRAARDAACSITVSDFPALVDDWLEDCRLRHHSPRTIELRLMLTGRLKWFLDGRGALVCGPHELKKFFLHLTTGHEKPGGRWGEGALRGGTREISGATLNTYRAHFKAFFSYLVEEEYLPSSPMAKLRAAEDRRGQMQTFTDEQIEALLAEAHRSRFPRRNEAIIRFLLDTGVRASELCGLQMKDVDVCACRAWVLGKGDKRRRVTWGRACAKALRAYLRHEELSPDDPLFASRRGSGAGGALTPMGLRLLITKTGKRAGIQIEQCSPHTFRHTFACDFMRSGGDLESLREILGHTTLKMTLEYARLGSANIERQQRQFSPGDRMARPKR